MINGCVIELMCPMHCSTPLCSRGDFSARPCDGRRVGLLGTHPCLVRCPPATRDCFLSTAGVGARPLFRLFVRPDHCSRRPLERGGAFPAPSARRLRWRPSGPFWLVCRCVWRCCCACARRFPWSSPPLRRCPRRCSRSSPMPVSAQRKHSAAERHSGHVAATAPAAIVASSPSPDTAAGPRNALLRCCPSSSLPLAVLFFPPPIARGR
jgi:hypothetical protein